MKFTIHKVPEDKCDYNINYLTYRGKKYLRSYITINESDDNIFTDLTWYEITRDGQYKPIISTRKLASKLENMFLKEEIM